MDNYRDSVGFIGSVADRITAVVAGETDVRGLA